MLEIAGGIVLGGIILFIMAAFAEELIKLALWVVGIIAAILVIIAAAYMVGSSLAVAGVQPDDRFADGLFALVPIAALIFLAVKFAKWTKRIQISPEEQARLSALRPPIPEPNDDVRQKRKERRQWLRRVYADRINSEKRD